MPHLWIRNHPDIRNKHFVDNKLHLSVLIKLVRILESGLCYIQKLVPKCEND